MSDPPQKKIKHWNARENLYYNFYLIFKIKKVTSNKKSTKIYVDMARFINSKTAAQCRTHHQKKISDFKRNKEETEKPEVQYLRHFYYENYVLRKLTEDHLRTELMFFLDEMRKRKAIPYNQLEELRDSINPILQELAFSRNYSKQSFSYTVSQSGPSEGDTSQQVKIMKKGKTKRNNNQTKVKEQEQKSQKNDMGVIIFGESFYKEISEREQDFYLPEY